MNEPALTLLKQLCTGNTLPAGSRLLIAVSGGADSMALLHLYTRVRDELRLEIAAATFDHGLRADTGHDDARFVVETARAWGVTCFAGRTGQASPEKGVEAWARQVRYAFLAKTARAFGAATIATAHHADDQAETVLAKLVRGAGGRGLSGIRPRSAMPDAPDLTLIRPLLSATRADLVAYCRGEGIAWREDATNTDTRYQRNWFRHRAIPLLRDANPDVTGALARLASISAEQDDYFQLTVQQLFEAHATASEGRVWLPRTAFAGWHTALQKHALIHAQRLIEDASEPVFERIEAAARMVRTPEGGIVELGHGVQVEIDGGWLLVSKQGAAWSPPYRGYWMTYPTEDYAPKFVPVTDVNHASAIIKIRIPHDAEMNVRCRRAGDRVYPRALMGRGQKLKHWLINRKVPRLLRDYLPVIEAAGQIVAIWDGRNWETFTPQFPDDTIEVWLTLNN